MNSINKGTERFYFNLLETFGNQVQELYYKGEIRLLREEKTISDLKSKLKKQIEQRFKQTSQGNQHHPMIMGEQFNNKISNFPLKEQENKSQYLIKQQETQNQEELISEGLGDFDEIHKLMLQQRIEIQQNNLTSLDQVGKIEDDDPLSKEILNSNSLIQNNQTLRDSNDDFEGEQKELQKKKLKPNQMDLQKEIFHSDDSGLSNESEQSIEQNHLVSQLNHQKLFDFEDDEEEVNESQIKNDLFNQSKDKLIDVMNYRQDLSELSEQGQNEIIKDHDMNQIAEKTEENYLYGLVSRIQIPKNHRQNQTKGVEALRIYNFQLGNLCGRINGLDVIFHRLKLECQEKY